MLCAAGPTVGPAWYCPTITLDEDAEATVDESPVQGGGPVPGYAVRTVIGTGGMGTVYLAERLSTGEVVALKLLTNHGSTTHAARFARECGILSRLDIDGAVRVVEHGVSGGRPWLAMEWVQGPDLATVLERNPDLEPAECVRIVQAVARTVGQLHEAGIVHRDLKPSNIVLRPDGQPVLVDFGLTRRLENVTQHLTMRPLGTPAYMAPELLKSEDVDWVLADIYSLGAVLARCLLGRTARGDWDLEGIPDRWRAPLARALSARPDRRHARAEDFAEDLDGSRSSRPLRYVSLLGAGLLVALAAAPCLPGTTEQPIDPDEVLAPWKAALVDHPDAEEQVFDALLLDRPVQQRSALWQGRAEHLDTPEAWGTAWLNVDAAHRPRVFDGLVDALWKDQDFDALDAVVAGWPEAIEARADGDHLRAWVDTAQLRIDEARERLPPRYAAALAPFRQTREFGRLRPLPTDRRWACDSFRCEAADGEIFARDFAFWAIPANGRLFGWEPGRVHDLDRPGHTCDLPAHYTPFHGAWHDDRLYLVATGSEPSLLRLDPDDCSLQTHPDQPSWHGSYVHAVGEWDMDDDGTEELVVLLGPGLSYEMRVYGADDELLERLSLGAARAMAVWEGALVVTSEPPHGNAEIFPDMPPVGAHRIVLGADGLEITHSWPGRFREPQTVDLDGDGTSVLMLAGTENRVLLLPDPESEPLYLGGFWSPHVASLDDDPAQELALRRPDGTHLLIGDGGSPPSPAPRPARPPSTGDAAVDRALKLSGLGLHAVAARALAIEAMKRPRSRAPWRLVAELQTAAEHPTEAIAAWIEAARGGDTEAWRIALDASLREGDIDGARQIAAEAGLLGAVPPVHEERFDRVDSWTLRSPLARWNAERHLLQLSATGGAGIIARLPLSATEPAVGLQLDFTIDQLDYGADVWFRLVDAGGDGPYVRAHAFGSRKDIHRTITPQRWEFSDNPDPDPFGPHRQTVTLALEAEGPDRELVFRNLGTDGSSDRRVVPSPTGGPPVAFEIHVAGSPGSLADVSLHSLTLWGLEPSGASSPLPAPTSAEREAARTTRLRTSTALERLDPLDHEQLERVYRSVAQTWRMHRSLSRLGERIRELPGIDQPAVWQAHPELALILTDARLVGGDALGALEILDALEPAADTCARRQILHLHAVRSLGRDPRDARRALEACGEAERVVRDLAWSLSLDL